MKKSFLFLMLLAATLLVPGACGTPTQVQRDVPLAEPFWLEAGGVAVLRDGSKVLRFRRIVNDSRCPADALILCVDAGSATVELSLASEVGDESLFVLNTNAQYGLVAMTVGDLRVELLEVRPPARLEPPLEPGDYEVRLMVTRP
jgi:hypothetical protein